MWAWGRDVFIRMYISLNLFLCVHHRTTPLLLIHPLSPQTPTNTTNIPPTGLERREPDAAVGEDPVPPPLRPRARRLPRLRRRRAPLPPLPVRVLAGLFAWLCVCVLACMVCGWLLRWVRGWDWIAPLPPLPVRHACGGACFVCLLDGRVGGRGWVDGVELTEAHTHAHIRINGQPIIVFIVYTTTTNNYKTAAAATCSCTTGTWAASTACADGSWTGALFCGKKSLCSKGN